MALTAYQTQFKRRMKRAIRLRAKADQKARRYAQLLADAIGTAEDAATQMNALNQLVPEIQIRLNARLGGLRKDVQPDVGVQKIKPTRGRLYLPYIADLKSHQAA